MKQSQMDHKQFVVKSRCNSNLVEINGFVTEPNDMKMTELTRQDQHAPRAQKSAESSGFISGMGPSSLPICFLLFPPQFSLLAHLLPHSKLTTYLNELYPPLSQDVFQVFCLYSCRVAQVQQRMNWRPLSISPLTTRKQPPVLHWATTSFNPGLPKMDSPQATRFSLMLTEWGQ